MLLCDSKVLASTYPGTGTVQKLVSCDIRLLQLRPTHPSPPYLRKADARRMMRFRDGLRLQKRAEESSHAVRHSHALHGGMMIVRHALHGGLVIVRCAVRNAHAQQPGQHAASTGGPDPGTGGLTKDSRSHHARQRLR